MMWILHHRSNPDQHDECLILVGDNEVTPLVVSSHWCDDHVLELNLQGTVTVIKTSNIKEAFK